MIGKKKWKRSIASLLSFFVVFTMFFPFGIGQASEIEEALETIETSREEGGSINKEETTSADSIIVEPIDTVAALQGENTGDIIVKYKEGREKQAEYSISSMGMEEVQQSDNGVSLYTVQPGEDLLQVVAELEQNPAVEYAEPNHEYTVFSSDHDADTDEYFSQQWALENIKAKTAWEKIKGTGGTVTVAVVDTGVDASHPDLANRVVSGENLAEKKADGTLYPENRDSNDDNGHGTQVAGVISAIYHNQIGIAGAAGAADVKIYPVKVMNDKGAGTAFDIAKGIQHAAEQNVDIINLSLGGMYSKTVDQAVKYAQNKGILVVAAAGNSATNVDYVYPAALPDVVTVGAITETKDKIATFSNQGSAIDVVAPGERIRTTTIKEKGTFGNDSNGYYTEVNGTSFAAPYVAAVAALYKLQNTNASALEIASAITGAATDLGTAGRDDTFGYGKLDAAKTLDPNIGVEEPPVIQLVTPAKNGQVMNDVSIQARVADKDVQTVKFYINNVAEENILASVSKQGEQTLYETTWDTKGIEDGSHTVWAVAFGEQGEMARTSVPVLVHNNPTYGLMLNVLDPEGNKAPGAKVNVYTKVPVSEEEARATASYTYKLVWSGSTDRSGVARVPGTIVTDLTTVSVVVYGGFDYNGGAVGNAGFLYSETIEGPGAFIINGEKSVPVTLTTLGEAKNKLETTQYFATLLDDQGAVVGTTTPLNDEGTAISTVFMNKGTYNIFSYSKAVEATYFLHERAKQITAPINLVFDGSKAGEVGLDKAAENKIVNGVLYLFSEGTQETIGVNDEVLVGRKLLVTPGSYDFWADVEVEDVNGGENWIYVFGTGETGEKLIEVPENGKSSIQVGKTLALTEFAPDIEEMKLQLGKIGQEYIEDEDEYTTQKRNSYFYTKQKFTDAYGNMLVGMYRGSLESSGVWKKQDMYGENSIVSRLDEQNSSWEIQDYYFGNIYPEFKVYRQDGNVKIYQNKFRQFYMWAFWALGLNTVTPGKYDVTLTLSNNPLAGKEIVGQMVNTIKDDRQYETVKTTLNGKALAANITIYHSAEEDGKIVWEKSTSGKANATTGEFAIDKSIKLSTKKNGNLAKVIYILTDKEYEAGNKGEYLFAFRQFTTLDELKEFTMEDMQRVEISARDENGNVIANTIRRDRGIIFQGEVAGEAAPFYQFTGGDYKKEVVWLEPGTYHFDSHYIVQNGQGKKTNYYLFEKNVPIRSGGSTNRVAFDAAKAAKLAFEADTTGYHDFRGISLFMFNPYRHEIDEVNTAGHTFYLAADIPYELDTRVTLGDRENPAYTWNYFLEEQPEQSFKAGEEKTWKIGKFGPHVSLDKTTLSSTDAVSGRSGVTDEYGNKVMFTYIDEDSNWNAASSKGETPHSLVVRQQADGQIEVARQDEKYSIEHVETAPAGPAVTTIQPYLRIYKKQANGEETRIFNESKAAYYEGFTELGGQLGSGTYRVELAFSAGPNGPVATEAQFNIPGAGGSSGGSGGGSGSVQTPVTGETKSVSNAQIDQAVTKARTTNAPSIVLETGGANAVSLTIDQFTTLKGTEKAVEIMFNDAIFTIPPTVLSGLPTTDAKNIAFSATALRETEARNITQAAGNAAIVKKVVGNIFELRITATTKTGEAVVIKTFADQLQVGLPVPQEDQAMALAGNVQAHRFNPDTKKWDYIGGTYDAATKTLNFTTGKFSTFALLITEEVMEVFELTDVAGHWAETDIQFMIKKGYVKGVGNGKFAPNNPITRAEFTAILARMLDMKENSAAGAMFNDLSPDHWAYSSVQAAAKAGLITGYENGQFKPEQNITREEISSLLIRALQYKGVKSKLREADVTQVLHKFKDRTAIAAWAQNDVAVAVQAGMASGRSHDQYAPRANATRAEGTVLLKRALEQLRN